MNSYSTSWWSLLLINRPREDERLSWPCCLTHKVIIRPASSQSQDRESSQVKDQRSTHCATPPTANLSTCVHDWCVVAELCHADTVHEVDVESFIDDDAKWQTGFYQQYKTLVRRNLLRNRDRYLSKLNFSQVLFVAVFAGLIWFRTDRTERTAEDRIGIVSTLRLSHSYLQGAMIFQ